MAAEPARRVELQAREPRGLSLQRTRELAALVDEFYDADEDGTKLGEAITRWAFECGDVAILPAAPELRAEGAVLVPVTPWGEVRMVYLSAPAPRGAPAPRARRATLRDLGAQPIDKAANG